MGEDGARDGQVRDGQVPVTGPLDVREAAGGWRPVGARPPFCGQRHAYGSGWLDEGPRRLSHPEYAVGQQLANEGHRVRARPEHPGRGPVADLDVCGVAVEVKSFLALPDRSARAPSARSVFNKLVAAERQGTTAVLYARDSGLSETAAREGVHSYGVRSRRGRLEAIRVVGDGFDLSWGRHRQAERRPEPPDPSAALLR